ncbi:hypothetical protein [Vibrio comitans]|uniref:Uncharacterized protein n=1 Tax=Vibrio comitans NBRC 102076 TaxID=1219078 RepID=A0A4Y3ING7_9VIBR|nr:hypothetical protein [Vibrio comitans]GEA60374.1 hypothetical protein VCO01S_15670 [Vibrio comitans NBRC 102076]
MTNTVTILITLSDLRQIQGLPVVLLPAYTPNGKQPESECAILTNCANSMNKSLLSINEAKKSLWFTHNGFHEEWRLSAVVVEINPSDLSFKVYGLLALNHVQSPRY